MIKSIDEFADLLNQLNPEDDEFVLQTDELVEQLSGSIAPAVYPVVFTFFENHSECDCGAPGSLVHHVERYYPNYVDSLLISAKTKPSYNSILMLNRILNSEISASHRDEMLAILNSVASDEANSDLVRELASDFIQHQTLRDD